MDGLDRSIDRSKTTKSSFNLARYLPSPSSSCSFMSCLVGYKLLALRQGRNVFFEPKQLGRQAAPLPRRFLHHTPRPQESAQACTAGKNASTQACKHAQQESARTHEQVTEAIIHRRSNSSSAGLVLEKQNSKKKKS